MLNTTTSQRTFLFLYSLMALMLSGCATTTTKSEEQPRQKAATDFPRTASLWNDVDTKPSEPVQQAATTPPISLKHRLVIPPAPPGLPDVISQARYTFSARNVSLPKALRLFANSYGLNLIIDNDVSGKVSVDFRDLPLKSAFEIMLGSRGYYWQWQDGLIRVGTKLTKTFVVDYLRLARAGVSSSTTSIAASGSLSNGESNTTKISRTDNVAFWDELSGELAKLISSNGRLVINRLSGTIQISDDYSRVKEVESYLDALKRALHRQVVLDTRVVEVTLSDHQAMGVDWTNMTARGFAGAFTPSVVTPTGGVAVKLQTASLGYSDPHFDSLISALQEQGNVKVMSQPRIRTLNNQSAVIKVGTDRTFFTKTSTSTATTTGADTVVTETPTTVTEGLVLSVTPQISSDNRVMLDISPVITRVTDTTVSSLGSTAPVLDIKQASALVRVANGEMIVLGGLIQDEETDTVRKVPFLGAIPWMGNFFKGTYKTKVRKELVIFLIPRIVS